MGDWQINAASRTPPFDKGGMGGISSPLHYRNLLLCQSVQLINQPVDLPIGGVDLALDGVCVMTCPGFRQLLMQGEHLFHELHHPVMAGLVGGVVEVDGADGKF